MPSFLFVMLSFFSFFWGGVGGWVGGLFLCLSVAATLFQIVTVIGCSSVFCFLFFVVVVVVFCCRLSAVSNSESKRATCELLTIFW